MTKQEREEARKRCKGGLKFAVQEVSSGSVVAVFVTHTKAQAVCDAANRDTPSRVFHVTEYASALPAALAELDAMERRIAELEGALVESRSQLMACMGALDVVGRSPKCSPCSVCGDGDHHWLEASLDAREFTGDPLPTNHPLAIVGPPVHYECKHCEAWTFALDSDEDDWTIAMAEEED